MISTRALRLLAGMLCWCCCASAASAEEQYRIEGVRVEGNQRVDTAAIIAQLDHTSGAVSDALIAEEVREIFRTGYFTDVRATLVEENSRRFVRYTVIEKPIVRKVFIQGNEEIEERELAEIFRFGSNRFLDRGKIEALIRAAVSLYESRGFFDAAFEYNIVPVGENQVDLVLTAKEGSKYRIDEVRFRGLEQIDPDDLRDVMLTKRHKWWSSWLLGTGRLNREMLEHDRALLRQYFLDHGFVDAGVGEPEIKAEDGELVVTFPVEEGRRYSIGEITVSGDLLEAGPEATLEGIESQPGETFSASELREDAFRVSDKFTDIGYAFANVVPNTRVNPQTATVDVDFVVAKGEEVTVNRIEIRGNEKTYDNVIRRELRVEEQQRFSSSKVRRSQQLLERLGYFEEVSIATEPAAAPDAVNLAVNVREAPTGSFSAGAGYSSSDGIVFTARLSENNIGGTGRSASINADIGSERDSFVLAFGDRRLWDTHVAGTVEAVHSVREFSDFDRELSGGSLEFGYPFEQWFGEAGEDMSGYLKYEYLRINITEVDVEDAAPLIIDSQGRSSSSSLTPRIVRNTINNPLDPRRGSRQVISFEAAGPGGSEEFLLFEARNQWYYPLTTTEYGDITFSWRTAFGYGEGRGGDDLPLFRRYFPGGINSVRGFKSRSLGPKDDEGNEFGGAKQFVNNFEVIFPLISSAGLRGLVFFDAGEAFDDEDSIDFGDLRQAYGFGIRWNSPLGPIRVEFGIPIDREEGEDSLVTLFSFGAPL